MQRQSTNIMRKSDKAVCTNDTNEDLTKALTYEAVFTTLVENKVLAIKRDCEEKKRAKRKKRKSFGRILFRGKKIFGSKKAPEDESIVVNVETGNVVTSCSPSQPTLASQLTKCHFLHEDLKDHCDVIEEAPASPSIGYTTHAITSLTTNIPLADSSLASTVSNGDNDRSFSSDKNGSGDATARNLVVKALTHQDGCVNKERERDVDAGASGESGSSVGSAVAVPSRISTAPVDMNKTSALFTNVADKVFDVSSLGSCFGGGNDHNTSTMADDSLTSIRDSIESLSFASSRCTVSFGGTEIIPGGDTTSLLCEKSRVAKRLRILEAKSISAQCSPILARQKSILAPTTSTPTPTQLVSQLVPVSLTVTLPATSISCATQTQVQPLQKYLQKQVSYTDSMNADVDAEAVLRYFSRQNTSEDSANLTVSTLLNEGDSASLQLFPFTAPFATKMAVNRSKSKSTSLLAVSTEAPLHYSNFFLSISRNNSSSRQLPLMTESATNKETLNVVANNGNKNNNNINLSSSSSSSCRARLDSLPTVAANNAGGISGDTKTSNYFPAMTSTKTAAIDSTAAAQISRNSSGCTNASVIFPDDHNGGSGVAVGPSAIVPSKTLPGDTAKLHRMTSTSTGSSVAPTGCCATTKSSSRDKEKGFKPSWPMGQSGSDDEYRKRKRKYKRYHRCSDPVLVYPSPSGLQHCILSMPPNQPIQFHYNEDFVYDMTLQVESDKNDDLQEIVPSSRHRKHRHRKHKKRHRHKKSKILLHDLETKSVKVIDPDDLPQKARWTIIATAFLLLLMCLMLVGITLRMAPLIDDMDF